MEQCHAIHLSLHLSPHLTEPSPVIAAPACNPPAPNTQACRVRQVGRTPENVLQLMQIGTATCCIFLYSLLFCVCLSYLPSPFLPAPVSVFSPTSFHTSPTSSTQKTRLPFHPRPSNLRTRCQSSGGMGFSLTEVHQELQMLQRQLADKGSASCLCMLLCLTHFKLNKFNGVCNQELIPSRNNPLNFFSKLSSCW